jgi:hypothetical protein
MEAICFSETYTDFQLNKRRYITESNALHKHSSDTKLSLEFHCPRFEI